MLFGTHIGGFDAVQSKLTDPLVHITVYAGHTKWYIPSVQQGPTRTIPIPIRVAI